MPRENLGGPMTLIRRAGRLASGLAPFQSATSKAASAGAQDGDAGVFAGWIMPGSFPHSGGWRSPGVEGASVA